MKPSNLLVIAPSRLFREGLKRLFDGSSFHVVAEMADPATVGQDLDTGVLVDIVLIELDDVNECHVEVLRSLHDTLPNAKIVALALRLAPGTLQDVSSHISAILPKDLSSSALFHVLELVVLDENVVSIASEFLTDHKELPNPIPSTAEAIPLSSRELDILRHIATGLANKAIARKLDVAETTVKAYVKTILKKTKAENRTQAAVWCIANGLSTSDQADTSEFISYRVDGISPLRSDTGAIANGCG